MGSTDKKEYSEALLKCSVPRHMVAVCPLAFGEVGVKERVKSVLRYKKPAFWVVLIAVVVCLVAGVCFLTDPPSDSLYSFPDLPKQNVTCVDLLNRKGHVCLSSEQELSHVISKLKEIGYNKKPFSEEIMTDTLDEYGWSLPRVVINGDGSTFTFFFSRDFSQVWASDELKNTPAYSVDDPGLIQAFFEEMIDPVRNEQTSGQPFANVGEPWEWIHNVSMDCIQSAVIRTVESNSGYSSATISSYRLRPLLEILNAIPKSAVTADAYYEKTTAQELFYANALASTRMSVVMADTVNNMIVILRCLDGQPQIILHEELEKMWDGGYYPQNVQVWNIDSDELTDCLMEMYAHSPQVSSFVGSDYEWDNAMTEVSGAGATITMRIIADWEREIVEYTEDCTSFGIRCRPAGVNEGWIYFSFWPEGYCPEEVNREYRECSSSGFYGYTSYPIAVTWPYGSGDDEHIWAYHRYYTDIGDYAVINEGADSWLYEYENEITAIQSFSQFTGGTQLERGVPKCILEPIEYTQSEDPQSAPEYMHFELADELTLTLGGGWMYDKTPATHNGHPILFSFWPEYETNGKITVEYREGFFYPGVSIAMEPIRVYRPTGLYYEGYTGTVKGDDRWTYLWINCKNGSFVFHFEGTEHWHEEKIDAAVSEIGEMGFNTIFNLKSLISN